MQYKKGCVRHDLIWPYAGQSKESAARPPPYNPMTCTLDTACLSYQDELCLRSIDHGILNLLISLLWDTHMTKDRHCANEY